MPWALGALLLYLIFSAIRIGTADFLSIQAADAAKEPSPSALADAARKLAWAQRLTPDDPNRLEETASLAMRRASLAGDDRAARQAALQPGLVHARRAVELRPAYAYGWAILLKLKHRLGEYDAEFHRALAATMRLGPWEPGLQILVVDAGLSAWPTLSGEEQVAVMACYLRGLHRQEEAMAGLLRKHNPPCADGTECAQ